MALSLNSTLLAAQTATSRRPIAQLVSGRLGADYPFTGSKISNSDQHNQSFSSSLFLNDGRYAILYASSWIASSVLHNELRLVITDTAITSFGGYVLVDDLTLSYNVNFIDTLCTSSNNIGAVVQLNTDRLAFYRISPAGAQLSKTVVTGLSGLLGASVCKTASGYVAIFIRLIGSTYSVFKATSTDFITWGTSAEITIPGLDTSKPMRDPKIIRLADGSYFLLLSYASLTSGDTVIYNIGNSTSSDLSTWSTLAAVTTTDAVNQDYYYPDVVQKPDGSVFISAQESNTFLTVTKASAGWNSGNDMNAANLHVDEFNGKLYITSVEYGPGSKVFLGACKVDIDTWTIERFFDQYTAPPVNSIFASSQCITSEQSSGEHGQAVIHTYSSWAVAVIDYDTDFIRYFWLTDQSGSFGYDATQNVNNDIDSRSDLPGANNIHLFATSIRNNKLWFGFHSNYLYDHGLAIIAYIDLENPGPVYDLVVYAVVTGNSLDGARFWFFDNNISLIASMYVSDTTTFHPLFVVIDNGEESVIKNYNGTNSDFPKRGIRTAISVGNYIYATPYYDASVTADGAKWGLMEINLDNDIITYYYPDWMTGPDNTMRAFASDESTGEIFLRTLHGVVVFHYLSKTWERIENTVLLGMPPDSGYINEIPIGLAYDKTRKFFFYGDHTHVYLVPRYGSLTYIRYLTGNLGSFWGFTSPELLAIGIRNVYPQLAIPAAGNVYASWVNTDGVDTVSWDREEAFFDLQDYLTDEIAVTMSLDGIFQLSFKLASGHLFDPHNDRSLMRQYVQKGKGVKLKLGEHISGSDYWANQGSFVIKNQKISYERDKHPVIEIEAFDVRDLWSQHEVTSVNVSHATPEQALLAIITDNTPLTSSDLSIPHMPLSTLFDAQWLNARLSDIIDDVANRFQHFCTMGMDGKVVFRPITITASPVNTHQKAQIIDFSPDDTYSDLTNRITVTGQSLYDFETTYAEERLAGLNGTVGWYGFHKNFDVYYSDDKKKRAKNPRLVVVETTTSILFKLAGEITESITFIDPEDRYCVITVDAPNLVPILIAAIAIYVIGNLIGDLVISWGGGFTIPVGRRIEGIGLYLGLMVLGSMGNFQYEVYGDPVGYIKKTYSASVDDVEMQSETGMIVENKIDGFACHTPTDCLTIANFEMMVTKAQRNRIAVKKVAHLQDEIGDTVTVVHPYTGLGKNIFITNITRRYKPSLESDDGYFNDEVEGWAL